MVRYWSWLSFLPNCSPCVLFLTQPLQVLNEQGIQMPFLLQLFDKWGNPSPDQRVVVALKTSNPALKVKSSVTSQPIDKDGKACFVVDHVRGPKGEYALEFRGSFNKQPIHGPSVKLTIIPDPNKPVKLLVEYNTNSVFPAGGTLACLYLLFICTSTCLSVWLYLCATMDRSVCVSMALSTCLWLYPWVCLWLYPWVCLWLYPWVC
uniref:SMCHD1 Ig-like domain-containing protein n=1 Tax=Hucho hucho TaxID=62062 RepID=A0A4W5NT81_9TELE